MLDSRHVKKFLTCAIVAMMVAWDSCVGATLSVVLRRRPVRTHTAIISVASSPRTLVVCVHFLHTLRRRLYG